MSGFTSAMLAGHSVGAKSGGADITNTAASGNTVVFNPDGTTVPSGTTGPNWFYPTTANIGASYWVRTTKTAGNRTFSPADGTWRSLSGGITFSAIGGVSGGVSGDVELATDSGGVNIVAKTTMSVLQ